MGSFPSSRRRASNSRPASSKAPKIMSPLAPEKQSKKAILMKTPCHTNGMGGLVLSPGGSGVNQGDLGPGLRLPLFLGLAVPGGLPVDQAGLGAGADAVVA